MKRILLFTLLLSFCTPLLKAQLATGATCPNIISTDLDGNPIDLYAILGSGKEIILMLGASWSGPDNNYLASNALQDYYMMYGPYGTNEVEVIYISADPSINLEEFLATEVNELATFPVVHDQTIDCIQLFNLAYFPTIYRVCTNGLLQLIEQLNYDQLEDNTFNQCATMDYEVNPHLEGIQFLQGCSQVSVSVELSNNGFPPLFDCELLVTTTSGYSESILIPGPIASGQTLSYNLGNFTSSQADEITVSIISADELPEPPLTAVIPAYTGSTSHIRIDLLTDNYPFEISWTIRNSAMEIVHQSPAYADAQHQYMHDFFLNSEECYYVSIDDTFGDGMAWDPSIPAHLFIQSIQEDGDVIPIYTYNGNYEFSNESSTFEVVDIVPIAMSGTVYLDENENSFQDLNEPGIGGIGVHLDGIITYTDENGHYIFNDLEGNYSTVIIHYNPSLYPTATTPTTITLSGVTEYSNNFGLSTSDPNFNLNYVYTEPWFFCGFDGSIWFTVNNSGNQISNGELSIELDPLLTATSAYPEGYTVSGNTYTWDLTSIGLGEIVYFSVSIVNPGFEYMGQAITNTVTLTTFDALGSIVDQDTDSHSSTLFCSYDPNDKAGLPAGFTEQHFIPNGSDLEYLIRFQNTGNYQAFNIHVLDQLDADLDWSTFQIISTSHHCQPTFNSVTGAIDFFFPDIMLADSASNEPASHGFIRYSVSPFVELPEMTPVENTAYIYFDFNPAIVTNTTLHTVSDIYFGIEELEKADVLLYPNPTNDMVQIRIPITVSTYDIKITDFQGRIIRYVRNQNASVGQLSCADLPQGQYMVEIIHAGQQSLKPAKLIVQK